MRTFRSNKREMQISESELLSLTADMEDAHHDTLPALKESIEAWRPPAENEGEVVDLGLSRRAFLTRTGLLAAGGLLIASGGAAAASTLPRLAGTRSGALESMAAPKAPLDIRVAALAASLENLAVATYGAALSAAQAGKLGSVPNAVATFAQTAMAQHTDHAAAWNALIYSAGYRKITAPNAPIGATINAAFAQVTDVPGVAKLALSLEDAAAATYLEAVGVVSGKKAIETAATIQPVEMQHAAILNFVLGQYPVPQSFSLTTGAATLKDAPSIAKR